MSKPSSAANRSRATGGSPHGIHASESRKFQIVSTFFARMFFSIAPATSLFALARSLPRRLGPSFSKPSTLMDITGRGWLRIVADPGTCETRPSIVSMSAALRCSDHAWPWGVHSSIGGASKSISNTPAFSFSPCSAIADDCRVLFDGPLSPAGRLSKGRRVAHAMRTSPGPGRWSPDAIWVLCSSWYTLKTIATSPRAGTLVNMQPSL
mmetsp:Transcript_18097/g.43673  ORF Transcript_18097/g.43673 Transcript_18097/m.43673 type:complete len:209 (-) Transcript_18097:404-1030(-)